MKLDRNENDEGRGKYALLKLREAEPYRTTGTFGGGLTEPLAGAIKVLEEHGILDWGTANTEAEFFVIRLKDKYARHALEAYAASAYHDDREYSEQIAELARRAGDNSPWCKEPD